MHVVDELSFNIVFIVHFPCMFNKLVHFERFWIMVIIAIPRDVPKCKASPSENKLAKNLVVVFERVCC